MTTRAVAAERTRESVLDAMLARFRVSPYATIRLGDVADDAGVTVQTVIRQFGGKEPLMAATATREIGRIAAERAGAGFATRETAVAQLCTYYERDGDLIARFEQEAAAVPVLDELARRGRGVHVGWIEHAFAEALAGPDRSRRLAQLVAVLDVRCWQVLRRERGLSAAETEQSIRELVTAVVGEG